MERVDAQGLFVELAFFVSVTIVLVCLCDGSIDAIDAAPDPGG